MWMGCAFFLQPLMLSRSFRLQADDDDDLIAGPRRSASSSTAAAMQALQPNGGAFHHQLQMNTDNNDENNKYDIDSNAEFDADDEPQPPAPGAAGGKTAVTAPTTAAATAAYDSFPFTGSCYFHFPAHSLSSTFRGLVLWRARSGAASFSGWPLRVSSPGAASQW